MGLRDRIASAFGRRYGNVEHTMLDDGSYQLTALSEKRTVTYRSRERVVFDSNLILLALQEQLYGNQRAPELCLPSVAVDIALNPFVAGVDVSRYNEEKKKWEKPKSVTWTVYDALDHTKIFYDKKTDTTIGMRDIEGKFQFYFAAKIDGHVRYSIPFDHNSSKLFIKNWERIFQQEIIALNVRKYEAARLLPGK